MGKTGMSRILKAFERKLLIKLDTESDERNLPAINEVLCSSFDHGMEKDGFRFVNHTDLTEALSDVLTIGGKIFTAKYAGKTVGTVSCALYSVNRWYHRGEAMSLRLLGVLPDYQSKGIGRMLLNAVLAEADKIGVPVILTTPERNATAIRFYEKNGFMKVQFYWAEDHYTVKLFRPAGRSEPAHIKKVYECIALNAMMKHREICDTQLDPGIQKAWNTEFLPYIKNSSAEVCEDMRKAFRRCGISPKEYKAFSFDKMSGAAQSTYLGTRSVSFIKYEADKRFFGSAAAKLPKPEKTPLQRVSICTDAYSESVRIVTVRAGKAAEALFALYELREGNDGRICHFAAVDTLTGKVTTSVYSAGDTKCRRSEISLCDRLPDWSGAVSLALEAADKVDTCVLGLDLVYTVGGWSIEKYAANPSFKYIQQAERKGFKPRLSEALGYEVEARLVLK